VEKFKYGVMIPYIMSPTQPANEVTGPSNSRDDTRHAELLEQGWVFHFNYGPAVEGRLEDVLNTSVHGGSNPNKVPEFLIRKDRAYYVDTGERIPDMNSVYLLPLLSHPRREERHAELLAQGWVPHVNYDPAIPGRLEQELDIQVGGVIHPNDASEVLVRKDTSHEIHEKTPGINLIYLLPNL